MSKIPTSKQYKNLRSKMEGYLGDRDKLCFSKHKTMVKIKSQINEITNDLESDDLFKIFNKLIEKRNQLINKE
tara:strand:- start:2145 stop:2363 length:219 start_codon:yes stop_codon:yes gene_type:complete